MMKNKRIFTIIICLILAIPVVLVGCGKQSEGVEEVTGSMKLPEVIESVNLDSDDSFVKYADFKDRYLSVEGNPDGIIECPHYEVVVYDKNGNKYEVYSYSVSAVQSEVHSFGYFDCEESDFPLTVEIKTKKRTESAFVIPEKFGITPEVKDYLVKFAVKGFDDYNVLFNGKFNMELPYTIFVRKLAKYTVPAGYKTVDYDGSDGIITVKSHTVLNFSAGLHYVDAMTFESDSAVHLEAGAYIIAKQPDFYTEAHVTNSSGNENWQAFFRAEGVKNVSVTGYGVIDFSEMYVHARHPLNFQTSENIRVEGITLIGAGAWNLLFTDCINVGVEGVKIFAYKINSDGIALCNTKNGLVENCWIRSGDDLFEVKATRGSAPLSGVGGKDIVFRHNQAWADKTRSFGFIQETEMDVSDILFEDCSSLLQAATWDEAMGSFLVVVGDGHEVKNVIFRNCDSYYNIGYVINVSVGPNQWTVSDLPTDAHNQESFGYIKNVRFENFTYYYDYSGESSFKGEDSYGNAVTKGKGINISLADYNHAGVYGEAFRLQEVFFKNFVQDGKKVNSIEELPIIAKTKGVDYEKNNIQYEK